MSTNGNNALLEVRDLKTYFRTEEGVVRMKPQNLLTNLPLNEA